MTTNNSGSMLNMFSIHKIDMLLCSIKLLFCNIFIRLFDY